ncbi:MAG: Gfo/Idh/MocA family oxidoreductase [Alphaproteobacteria bacterium]|nr:Gfo/Idh/MocA family oxidoreductase [Alphaproteobacteria bacterium]
MSGETPDADTYALRTYDLPIIDAPTLNYTPPMPQSYRPRIALIGAGGIASAHLDAYRKAGFDIAAICNRTLTKAEALRAEFFPNAVATDNYDDLLNDTSIAVFDITPHPDVRFGMIEKALAAGKHVLSQKPFVTDLDAGETMIKLARENGVRLAVNQNGRWAPHMAYMREAVRTGLIGEVTSSHAHMHWDHSWIARTPFNDIHDLILYDFGVHWFDFMSSLLGDRMQTVFATQARAKDQSAKPPLLSQTLIQFEGGQSSLVFDGSVKHGALDSSFIGGTKGSLYSVGKDLNAQSVTLTTERGEARPELVGTWFNDGFAGTMGELLSAIEENREPNNGASGNLQSLALTFAAIKSAHTGAPIEIGTIRALP